MAKKKPAPLDVDARAALQLVADDSGQAAEDRNAAAAALAADYQARIVTDEAPAEEQPL